jgi:hypothetical protein
MQWVTLLVKDMEGMAPNSSAVFHIADLVSAPLPRLMRLTIQQVPTSILSPRR